MNKPLILIAVAGALAHAQPAALSTIHVNDVVESVREQYPPLLAALADREIADADVLSAQGRFDTILRARVDSDSFGYYQNQRFDSSVEQPLAWNGASLFGGYRLGDGAFAPYDGKLATRSLGEVRSGFRVPLIRDRVIDSRRGELTKAQLGKTLANLSIDQQKLAVLQSAISRYWTWAAAGQRLRITKAVLEAAETRQKLLDEAVKEGQLPAIDAVDNQRAILQRRSSVVEAERAFVQSAIDLSLFYRDASGKPIVPELGQVPDHSSHPDEAPASGDLEAALKTAHERRPEIRRLKAQAEQNGIDLQLAQNQSKPAVDLVAGFYGEGGSAAAVKRGPQELRAGLSFEFPFQNRAAKGKEAAAAARAKQLEIRLGFTRDQISAEVQDTLNAVQTAAHRLKLLTDEVRVSRELEEAERSRFEFGEGTLFMLNLREQATLEAAVRHALARADLQRAKAAHDYATGTLL